MRILFCAVFALLVAALPAPARASGVPASWPPTIATSSGFKNVGQAIAQEPGFPKDGSPIDKANYIFSRMSAVATSYNLKAGSGWPIDSAIIQFYRTIETDPEAAGPLKGGYGHGNCAEWSYAFSEILGGAGVVSQVMFGDNSNSQGHSLAFWGTDTALFVTETLPDGNTSRRVFDVFQAAFNSGSHQPTSATLQTWGNLPMSDADVTANDRAEGRKSWLSRVGKKYAKDGNTENLLPSAPQTGRSLTIEVLDSLTNKPIALAKVTLYKPVKFPGIAVASTSSGAGGEAVFSGSSIDKAKLAGAARVGASRTGYASTVQDVATALLTEKASRYVVYLKKKPFQGGLDMSGKWHFNWTWSVTSVDFVGTMTQGGATEFAFDGKVSGGGNAIWTAKEGSATCTLSGKPNVQTPPAKLSCSASFPGPNGNWTGATDGAISTVLYGKGKKIEYRGRGKGTGGDGKPAGIDSFTIEPK